jgi:hypothetical protein
MDISRVATAAFPGDAFPIKVAELAKLYSQQVDPSDAIREVKGANLPGFEGGLYPLGDPRDAWCVLYNDAVISTGRQRFTIAHEFGHWLMHRRLIPREGISCNEDAVIHRAGDTDIEKEADTFAAYLLMPLDAFRQRIPADARPSLSQLIETAEFFGVSPTAAVLRWLEYTQVRAIMIVSIDGGMKWAKSSEAAFRSGRFFRTRQTTCFVPDRSCVGRQQFDDAAKEGVMQPAGVWFDEEPTFEMTAYMAAFETALTVLLFGRQEPSKWPRIG